jgi:hypothetical protein
MNYKFYQFSTGGIANATQVNEINFVDENQYTLNDFPENLDDVISYISDNATHYYRSSDSRNQIPISNLGEFTALPVFKL